MLENEWSYLIDSEDISNNVIKLSISAPQDCYDKICKRLGLASINYINVDLEIKRNKVTKVVHVKGDIDAEIYQKCVITTEPVLENVKDSFEAWFADPNNAVSFVKAKRERMSKQERSELPIMEEYEDPEDIIDGKIDLGELSIQYLSLSLCPYPKLEGANYENKGDPLEPPPEGTYDNPFAALKEWRNKESKK